MKCDLCNNRYVRSENNPLCVSCDEMIQRLLIVKQRMDFAEPRIAASAVTESAGEFIASQWQ